MYSPRVRLHLLAALTALSVLVPLGPAQSQTRFRGKPLSECKRFWITETGITLGNATYLMWEVGQMVNVSPRYALGGNAIAAYDTRGSLSAGVKARARRWLTPRLSAELSTGVMLYYHAFLPEPPGLIVQAGLNFGDWASLTGQMESAKGLDGGWSVGLKAGSFPGVVLIGLSAIGAGIAGLGYATGG